MCLSSDVLAVVSGLTAIKEPFLNTQALYGSLPKSYPTGPGNKEEEQKTFIEICPSKGLGPERVYMGDICKLFLGRIVHQVNVFRSFIVHS